MTSVLAVNTYLNILVIADCRVTWKYQDGKVRLQDNLQKIYQFGPTGVIGFASSIAAAQAVFQHFRRKPLKKLPPDVWGLVTYISDSARVAFQSAPQKARAEGLQLMYAAVNYGRISARYANATLAENVLVRFDSPRFEPYRKSDFVALGYAEKLKPQEVNQTRDQLPHLALDPLHQAMQLHIAIDAFGKSVARLAPKDVGGLFTAGVVQADGLKWASYSHDENLSIEFQIPTLDSPHQFIQRDKSTGRVVPLQSIALFNPWQPTGQDYKIEVPLA